MRPQGSHSPRHRHSAAARRRRAAAAPSGQPVWYDPPSPPTPPRRRRAAAPVPAVPATENAHCARPAPPADDGRRDRPVLGGEQGRRYDGQRRVQDPRDEAPTAPSRPPSARGRARLNLRVASPHAKIGNEGGARSSARLSEEHERLCELDRIARQQRLEAEAERDGSRRSGAARRRAALHQGQRITSIGEGRRGSSCPPRRRL